MDNLVSSDLKIKKSDDDVGVLTNSMRHYPRKKIKQEETELLKEVKGNLKR